MVRTILWIILVLAIGVTVIAIFAIRKAEVGPRLGRLLAVALASFAFYSPTALFEDVKVLPFLLRDLKSQWPVLCFIVLVVVIAGICIIDLVKHRREEIVGLKDAGTKFLVIGIAGVVARLCAGYLF